MTLLLKNTILLIGCTFFSHKLLNLPLKKGRLLLYTFLLPILSLVSTYTDMKQPQLNTLFIILCSSVTLHVINKKTLYTSITTTFISFALSFSFHILASLLSGAICLPFSKDLGPIFMQLLGLFIYLLLIPLPFKLPRLRKGMPFLENLTYAMPGTLIGITIIFVSMMINNKTYHVTLASFMLTIPFVIVFIYQYWQHCITKTYRDEVNLQNLAETEKELEAKIKELEQLREEKTRLEKIVHKDNKLIPAMELAVRNYLSNAVISDPEVKEQGLLLIKELNQLSKERVGILKEQELKCEQLPSTKIISTDALLLYLQQDALTNTITLQANITCDIRYLVEHVITEEEFNTLLADLLKNAIIATTHNKGNHILLSIHLTSDCYAISVFDSGIPFPPDVLAKWGTERFTTHADEGGNGIGMMTTYELVKKYHGSFIIHEFSNTQGYTKEVSIIFDKSNRYQLFTNRSKEALSVLSEREDLQIIYE